MPSLTPRSCSLASSERMPGKGHIQQVVLPEIIEVFLLSAGGKGCCCFGQRAADESRYFLGLPRQLHTLMDRFGAF